MTITRFAPSPTGLMHIGNARTALITYLFTRRFNGKFLLRIDDTDTQRCKLEYEQQIIEDLKWLGFKWDGFFRQSERTERYEEIKKLLAASGRLYECYETPEELDLKRKLQLSSGRPPIYDRAALNLSDEQKGKYKESGKKPHYRFLIKHKEIRWNDLIKGELVYHGNNLSDPIVIRENGVFTYMLCSAIDDADYKISHIIRGEDHITNTAMQIQMFEALKVELPSFAHLSLVKSKEDKISKRIGGFDIGSLKERGFVSMAINSFLANIGTSSPIIPYTRLENTIKDFDINKFSKSPATYIAEELYKLNHRVLSVMDFNEIKDSINTKITQEFWFAVRNNISTLEELDLWWNICYNFKDSATENHKEKEFLKEAAKLFPTTAITEHSWNEWTQNISKITSRRGKELYMPLRIAITGQQEGPELKWLLPLIGREEILRRILCPSIMQDD